MKTKAWCDPTHHPSQLQSFCDAYKGQQYLVFDVTSFKVIKKNTKSNWNVRKGRSLSYSQSLVSSKSEKQTCYTCQVSPLFVCSGFPCGRGIKQSPGNKGVTVGVKDNLFLLCLKGVTGSLPEHGIAAWASVAFYKCLYNKTLHHPQKNRHLGW